MNDLKRKQGESNEGYQIRLTLMKQNGADIDWSEIANLVNDGRSSEAFRKDSYGIRRYAKYIDECNPNTEQILELKKQKIQLTDLKTETNRQIRNLARTESMIELLKENIDSLNQMKPIVSNEFPNDVSHETEGNHAVLMLSDWHFGLEINNNINEFNPEICIKRVKKLTEKAIKHCKSNDVKCLHLYFLGDLISGNIRNIIRLQNRCDVSTQIIQVSELITEMIAKLSFEIPYITVHFCLGNHERSIAKKDDALEVDTYMPLIKDFVELRTEKLNNVVIGDNSYGDWVIVNNILGYTVVGTHGHYIKKEKANNQLSNIIDTNIDYVCLGHFHQNMSLTEYKNQTYVNGSLCGSDEYSKQLMLHTFPSQKLLIINKEDGIFAEYVLKVN